MLEPRFRDSLKDNTYRVIDGDTVEVLLDRGWQETKLTALRLYGIDTPESSTRQNPLERAAGKLVSQVVSLWMSNNDVEQLFASSESKPKYEGRTIGRLWSGTFANELSAYLIAQGLCRAYMGKHKDPWTDDELIGISERATAILST